MSETADQKLCLMPWVHLQVDPTGIVSPCAGNWKALSLGTVASQNLRKIWNGKPMRDLRLSFIQGKMPEGCEDCRLKEKWGSSPRLEMNKKFHELLSRVELTSPDGSLTEEPVSIGLDFSNRCNFRCRTCTLRYSSSIAKESFSSGRAAAPEARAFATNSGRAGSEGAGSDSDTTLAPNSDTTLAPTLAPESDTTLAPESETLLTTLGSFKEVHFSGGEPLLDDDHYRFLEALLVSGRNDVKLSYNTNLSVLEYSRWNITNLWSHFKNVLVFASFDAVGPQAELLRKGTTWSQVEENYFRLKKSVPHAQVKIYATVSAVNAFHLPTAIKKWMDLGMIREPGDLVVNVVVEPNYFCVQIFNEAERVQLANVYQDFLKTLDSTLRYSISTEIRRVLAAFTDPFDPVKRQAFRRANFTFDRIRSEKMVSAFPELMPLMLEESPGRFHD